MTTAPVATRNFCPRHKRPQPEPCAACAFKNAQKPTQAPPAAIPVTRMRDMVLLHYCFNQQAGETKKEHCFCEERAERVSREVAEEYVSDGVADWLIVKNSRARTGTSIFRRAVVIRSVVIEGQKLFAVSSKWKPKNNSRTDRHETIKAAIRDRAKNLLGKMFSKGVIAQDVFERLHTDAELDLLFADQKKITEFLAMLTGQEQLWFQKRFTEILLHWWNNVLGFHRLNVDAGTIMKDAPAGVGKIIYAPDSGKIDDQIRGNATVAPDIFIPGPLGEEVKFEDNNGRRVIAANHVTKPWDPSGGTDPQKFEGGDGTPDEDLPVEERSEEEMEDALDQPEGTY